MCTKQMKTNILFTFFLLLGLSISTSSVKGQNNCDSVWTSSRIDASKIDVTGTYELAYPLGQRLILQDDGTFKEELLFEYDTGSPIDSRIGTYSIRKDTLIAQFEGFILKNGATQSDLDNFLINYPKPVFKLDFATNDLSGSVFRKKGDHLFIVDPDLKQLFCISPGVSIINSETGEVESPDFLLKIK